MPRVDRIDAEDAIMRRFICAYDKCYGIKLANIVHRDKPDFRAEDPSIENVFALEVNGVYQDDREAMIQYGAIEDWGRFKGSSEELLGRLNKVLDSKARKSFMYDVHDPLHLAILVGSLVFNQAIDIDFIRPGIVIPDNAYRYIWLIMKSRDDYSPELYELQVPSDDQILKAV